MLACQLLPSTYRQDTAQLRKCRKYEIRFTRKITQFQRDFQALITLARRIDINSNIHQL